MNAHDQSLAARPNAPTTTYLYDSYDTAFVKARVAEFRAQVARRLDGSLYSNRHYTGAPVASV